jgi:hypothetical protein
MYRHGLFTKEAKKNGVLLRALMKRSREVLATID